MSQHLPRGHQTYIGNAKEVELQDSNDWPAQVLPLREVVTQPVTTVLPAANECGPTQDKRPLSSCLLDNTAKKCNKIIKNSNGNQKFLSSTSASRHNFIWKGIINETIIIVIPTHMKMWLQNCK